MGLVKTAPSGMFGRCRTTDGRDLGLRGASQTLLGGEAELRRDSILTVQQSRYLWILSSG